MQVGHLLQADRAFVDIDTRPHLPHITIEYDYNLPHRNLDVTFALQRAMRVMGGGRIFRSIEPDVSGYRRRMQRQRVPVRASSCPSSRNPGRRIYHSGQARGNDKVDAGAG